MRKLLALTVVMVFLLGFAGVAGAMSDTGLEESPAFEGKEGHWTHENGAPRFDTVNQYLAITGVGGHYADEDAVIKAHGDDSLVRAGDASDAE